MAWPRSFRHASPAVCKPAGSSQQWLLIVRKMSKIALVSHNGWRYSLLKSTVTEAVPLANSIIGMIHPSIMITVRFSCVIQRGRRGKTNHSPAHPLLKPFSFSSPPHSSCISPSDFFFSFFAFLYFSPQLLPCYRSSRFLCLSLCSSSLHLPGGARRDSIPSFSDSLHTPPHPSLPSLLLCHTTHPPLLPRALSR